jgi:hypothetical protein
LSIQLWFILQASKLDQITNLKLTFLSAVLFVVSLMVLLRLAFFTAVKAFSTDGTNQQLLRFLFAVVTMITTNIDQVIDHFISQRCTSTAYLHLVTNFVWVI